MDSQKLMRNFIERVPFCFSKYLFHVTGRAYWVQANRTGGPMKSKIFGTYSCGGVHISVDA
jgi:hypothetical protein